MPKLSALVSRGQGGCAEPYLGSSGAKYHDRERTKKKEKRAGRRTSEY